jgi:hypothetical protein
MKTVLILLTWFGAVPQYEQRIPTEDDADCDRMERTIVRNWKKNHVEGFVGVTMCREEDYVVE